MIITQMLRRSARIVAVIAAVLPTSVVASQMPTDADIRAMLLRRVATGKNPGIVVGIYENGTTRVVVAGPLRRA